MLSGAKFNRVLNGGLSFLLALRTKTKTWKVDNQNFIFMILMIQLARLQTTFSAFTAKI